MVLNDLGKALQQKQGELNNINTNILQTSELIETAKTRIHAVEEAQKILQYIAQETQKNLVVHISDVVSLALGAVFEEEAYSFNIDFVQKRGKTEADIYFERDGNRVDPMTASGGGAVDVASFALRVAFWQLIGQNKKINDTIILDEPFRFLSKDLQPKAGKMLKLISDKLGIQFLIVTHNEDLIDSADCVYRVKNTAGKASVERG
jgi:exonuclease SbcC